MTDQAPPPEATPPPSTTGQAPAEGQPAADGTQAPPQSVEEVENQWKHRVSQKDRAHAAAEQALRDERDTLQKRLDALTKSSPAQSNGQPASGGNDPAVEALRAQLEDQRRRADEAEAARIIEQRKVKYPALAASVGDADFSIFNTAEESTLAKLNAQLDNGSSGTGTFAPTAPRRTTPVPAKGLGDMNKAELEEELRKSVESGALKRS